MFQWNEGNEGKIRLKVTVCSSKLDSTMVATIFYFLLRWEEKSWYCRKYFQQSVKAIWYCIAEKFFKTFFFWRLRYSVWEKLGNIVQFVKIFNENDHKFGKTRCNWVASKPISAQKTDAFVIASAIIVIGVNINVAMMIMRSRSKEMWKLRKLWQVVAEKSGAQLPCLRSFGRKLQKVGIEQNTSDLNHFGSKYSEIDISKMPQN